MIRNFCIAVFSVLLLIGIVSDKAYSQCGTLVVNGVTNQLDCRGSFNPAGLSTTTNDIQARSFIGSGALANATGCSISAHAGNNMAGTYTSGTAGACTVTLTFTTTAASGWSCQANDITTNADIQHQTTGGTNTTAVISGTTASGDVVNYNCAPF